MSNAHPFTYSICKLYIGDQYISGNLDVSAENLLFFDYLNVDTTNSISRDEINAAAQAYAFPLSSSLVLKSPEGRLLIENFRMSDLNMDDSTSIGELKTMFLNYSFKIKIEKPIDQLDLKHTIGQNYPLISSLLILEIEGKDMDKSYENLASNQDYQISFREDKTEELCSLTLQEVENALHIKLQIPKAFLAEVYGDTEVSSENFSEIMGILSDNELLTFSPIQKKSISEKKVELATQVTFPQKSKVSLKWNKFNRVLKSIPTVLIKENRTKTLIISRYDRTIEWR